MLKELEDAYRQQKEFNKEKDIAAYKVGASNFRSAEAFEFQDIIVGGIERSRIFFNEIPNSYSVGELEIVCKVDFPVESPRHLKIREVFLGIECPEFRIENPNNSVLACIEDSCSAGDLIIFLDTIGFSSSEVSMNLRSDKIRTVHGGISQLCYSVDEILLRTLEKIDTYNLQFCNTMYIATGGISDTFSLTAAETAEFFFE